MPILSAILGLFWILSSDASATAKQTPAEASHSLNQIISDYAEQAKRLDAFYSAEYDLEENLEKFGDYGSPDYFKRRKDLFQNAITRLKSVPVEVLTTAEKHVYDIFKQDIEISLKGTEFPDEFLEFNQLSNRLHSYIDQSSQALTKFPFDSVKHYDAFVKRSEGFLPYIDRQIALLQRGIKERITNSCIVANATLSTYQDGLLMPIEKNPFYRPISFMPKKFSKKDRARLTADFRHMVEERIVPGFKKFDQFFRTEYMPHCRQEFGIGKLPHGKDWYKLAMKASTTLDLDAKAIHETGLKEVERISAEMDEIRKSMGFKGTLPEFINSLKNDPKHQFKSAKEMIAAFNKVKAAVAKKLPDYFSLLPKSDYKIVEASNPQSPSGQYTQPTDMVPYGRFILNTHDLKSVPKYDVTTLSLHETNGGHHLQCALVYELKDKLSEYQRRVYYSNSYVEGWALYAEYLGREMGMFTEPIQRLGNLNAEMLRAVRLVVDTGIHAMNWSQQQVVDYMLSHLAVDPHGVTIEANRYSVWPGQALGYKVGQMKILELRKHAEKELGKNFDLKEFHKVILVGGVVSMPVLENEINEWIKDRKQVPITERMPAQN